MEYGAALSEIRTIVARTSGDAAAARVVELLHRRFPHYSWVGIYWVAGRDLILGPWAGPEATEHTRIPIGTGVCGAAAASGRTEIVPDVSTDPRYLACFTSTRSEIVVPIVNDTSVVGEIDIDGTALAAFGRADQEFLEAVAALLAPLRPRRTRAGNRDKSAGRAASRP
jgi:GAF domain-containing protein